MRGRASRPSFWYDLQRMSPDEIKAVRKDLACTAKELALALDLDQATVLAWEKGDLFPTKQYIDKMLALRARGPGSIPRKAKGQTSPMQTMTDPQAWTLFRKLLAHKRLRDEVTKLAEKYPDPAED
jgi:DNA-binding XRE family transcriptional regulator